MASERRIPTDMGGEKSTEGSPSHWLRDEFFRIRNRNRNYSLRAFANRLGISSGPLSEILAGKRTITPHTANRIATALAYPPPVRETFFRVVAGAIQRRTPPERLQPKDLEYRRLCVDQFQMLADWYYFAILSYLDLDERDCHRSKMAKRLGISTLEVTQAIERLLRLNLIRATDTGFAPTYAGVRLAGGVPHEAVRRAHGQILALAQKALAEVSVEKRDITSITLAIDPDRIPAAKEKIRRFRRSLEKFLEGGNRRALYHLNVQLVPMTPGEAER